ncbi:MAG TPA: universal stress protein [Solirubrobacterales bacterium]|jgi:nucleotide-binding universal stress UspA family protein|nr:universal stress protein [Solirubrobacterales bacterium]
MFRRILVGYIDSKPGQDALELGRILSRANGADPIVVTATGEDEGGLAGIARAKRADLVVLGSTGRGALGRIVPGTTLARLLGQAACAVAVAPPGFAQRAGKELGWKPLSVETEDAGLRVIGVGFDGSRASREALEIASDLAIANGAALRVYTVARNYASLPGADQNGRTPGMATEAERMQEELHDAVSDLPSETRPLPVFLRGDPAVELVRAIELGVDLLVLGCRPGGPLRRALHQSVSNAILADSPCPVLIAPAGVVAPAAAPS